MPFTCPKWECRHEIPFSSKVDSCPECGTFLFLTRPPEPQEPEPKPKKEKKLTAKQAVAEIRAIEEKKEKSRQWRPLNDAEIKELLEEEERSWREPINSYYNDL